jgi:hypothetical protein
MPPFRFRADEAFCHPTRINDSSNLLVRAVLKRCSGFSNYGFSSRVFCRLRPLLHVSERDFGDGEDGLTRSPASFDKRASNVCPSADYTAPNGQTFSTTNLCLHNIAGDDITQQNASSLQDCMDICSGSPASIGCAGVA